MNTKPIDGPEALRLPIEVGPGGCSCFLNDDRCTGVATATGLMGCVHEHVKPVSHCEYHRKVGAAGRIGCRQCREAGVTVFVEVIYR